MSTHHILGLKKVPRVRLFADSSGTAGQLSWYGRTAAPREILLYTSSRTRFLNRTSIGERCKHRELALLAKQAWFSAFRPIFCLVASRTALRVASPPSNNLGTELSARYSANESEVGPFLSERRSSSKKDPRSFTQLKQVSGSFNKESLSFGKELGTQDNKGYSRIRPSLSPPLRDLDSRSPDKPIARAPEFA
ncbi:hypothetical protein LIER_39436 [Lithospermum erythrorhizon]|uniref:Uncharacterized protein n=1 Tax=Lithospermum erythrorhizon TaxID=34254 RepID=A0AAV3QIV8_LITER